MHVLLGLLLSASPPAHATTYAEVYTPRQLAERADTVVRGVVVSTVAEALDDGVIVTTVYVDVTETIMGRDRHDVSFRVPGGAVGSSRMTVHGAPVFNKGTEVVVFLSGERLVGFGQGAFGVEDGVARRTLENLVPGAPVSFDLGRDFGKPLAAESCIDTRLDIGRENGWAVRAADNRRAGLEEPLSWRMTLLQGNEYRFDFCGDGVGIVGDVMVTDRDGVVLARSGGSSEEIGLTFKPEITDEYYVTSVVTGMPDTAVFSAVSLGVTYR